MAPSLASRDDSVLLVVDLQPSFLNPIHEGQRVLSRAKFLVQIATLLGVPIIATEQYPERMGGTEEGLLRLLVEGQASILPKMSFSCVGCADFKREMDSLGRSQAVVVGIETHICVTETVVQLLQRGKEVFIGSDAISARSAEMHAAGMQRMRDAGAVISHSESVAYEWLGTADDPRFRDALKLVKQYA